MDRPITDKFLLGIAKRWPERYQRATREETLREVKRAMSEAGERDTFAEYSQPLDSSVKEP